MKSRDVRIGGVYLARVSGNRTRVRIIRERARSHQRQDRVVYRTWWEAQNLATGRAVRIGSAARLTPIPSAD